jgi:DNA repair protein RadD
VLTPRHYQEEAIGSLFQFFTDNPVGNPIVALPTGTGKALVIAEFMRRALAWYPNTRIMCLTHVKELVGQNFEELKTIWPSAPAGIYSAGLKRRDIHLPITFCGIASVNRNVHHFGFIDLVIVDECHLISDKAETMYAKVIGLLKVINPCLKVIGLTATPYRLGMGMLTEGKIFTHICCDWTTLDRFNQLVDEGFISPLVPRKTATELDVEGVGITQGEFNIDELQAAVDKDSVTRAALLEAKKLAGSRWSWLVFCAGTTHADHARDILNELGLPAVSVHSKLPGGDKERDENIARFKRMEVAAMCGVGVFTTGFNHKPVDCIVVLRPTMSAGLWVQMLGRGTRPSPETRKANCLVLDFAANTRRLGPINDPVIPRKRGKKEKGVAPYKLCPQCDTYNHARARVCVNCSYEFPAVVAVETVAATDELIRKKREAKPVEVPEIHTLKVDRVEWQKHVSRDRSKPPSLLVTYYCGVRIINEWLCLEHPPGYARRKARDAWRLMVAETDGPITQDEDPPETVEDALNLVDFLRPPSAIRVLFKGKEWPEVIGYDYNEHTPRNGVQAAVDAGDVPF